MMTPDPGTPRNPRTESVPIEKPKGSTAVGLGLPQGGLGAVFSAAFSAPNALPGVTEILRDDVFLDALSRTASFIADRAGSDPLSSLRRVVQALHRMESADSVRSVGRSLILGCAELFADRSLYLEQRPLSNAAGGQSEDTGTDRLDRLCRYLACIADLIQDAASQFKDSTLWKIIDDEFVARIHPPLGKELGQLNHVEHATATAILTVFERLDECAQSLQQSVDENRQIVVLLAGFILRRLAFVLKHLTSPEVRSMDDTGVRDRIAEKLAHKLGVEIEQYRTRRSAPLMQLLKEADGVLGTHP